VSLLVVILFFGPEQAIAGKYIRHSEEFLAQYPAPAIAVPEKLPADSAALAGIIETGSENVRVFEALGDALYAEGDTALAYRAYDRAHRLGHSNPTALQRKKDRCEPVAENVIRAEEHEAKVWVDALQSYERARLRDGEDPRDLSMFYARYGRSDESLAAIIRERQIAFWVGALSLLLGVALVVGCRRLRRRIAAVPLALAVLCLVGLLLSRVGAPYVFGAVSLGTAAVAVAVFGRRAA
jgi:tetratricopeptide (TPR) repeat protein